MTTTEQTVYLERIVAKCRENLTLAECRTQGKWTADGYDVRRPAGRMVADVGPHHTPPKEYPFACRREDEANGRYIAACAGSAEAGWMATIVCINSMRLLADDRNQLRPISDAAIAAIIDCWPEELL